MKDYDHKRPELRMVHVRLTEETHKRLRICAAETDMTLQDWVAIAIKSELDRQDREKQQGSCMKDAHTAR